MSDNTELIEYARTADISGDPLVIDLADALEGTETQRELADAAWANALQRAKNAEAERDRWRREDAAHVALLTELTGGFNTLADQLAAAQAVTAEAEKALAHDGERDYLERIYATTKALAQSPIDALDAVKAAVWEECSREWVARQVVAEAVISRAAMCVREEYPRAEAISVLGNPLPSRPVNPYRAATEGEKP